MHLNIPSLITTLALATTATADYMHVYKWCSGLGVVCHNDGSTSSQVQTFVFPVSAAIALSEAINQLPNTPRIFTKHCWLPSP
jgi:hypothetical protein